MQIYSRPAHETLHLPDRTGNSISAPWAVFDPEWYRLRYSDAPPGSADELLAWHLMRGQTAGHSPNRYFDEEWQRLSWPGIVTLIEAGAVASAFDAWCRGPHETRPPHWLFDPIGYRKRYPEITDAVLAETGLINLYHHYLSFGAAEHRIGHPLFDPKLYLAGLDPAETEAAASMPFRHFLCDHESGSSERRTSLMFDLHWYRERYPDPARLIGTESYRSLLEHYSCNERPTEFDPSPWFSEAYYLSENPGLADAIGSEGFRNGFAHFLAHGLVEGRSPHPDLDLAWYGNRDDVRADIDSGRANNAFVHWVAIGYPTGLPGRASVTIHLTQAQAVALYERRANIVCPLYGRHKLDFTCRGTPAVSVIMSVRDSFAGTMVSLASLRAQFRDEIELILIDSNPAGSAADIETHVTGASILRFGGGLTDTAAREAGLVCATAEAVLLLADGVDLASGAVDNALSRLRGDLTIGAVGGRLVQPEGDLMEAGGIIWRDGKLHPYASGASPLAAEANFTRDTDYCSTLFLLARRDVLASLPDQEAGIAGTTHEAADLCARIHQTGFRVVYEPDAVAFLTNLLSDGSRDGRAAFVNAHPGYLAGQPEFDPAAITRARSPDRGQMRILFVEDAIPLRRIGSGFVRSNDVLRAMVASGASVTVFPMTQSLPALSATRAEIPGTVEVMHDLTLAGFAEFIAARRGCYDLVWIARTHNLGLIYQALAGQKPLTSLGEGDLIRSEGSVDADTGNTTGRTEQASRLTSIFDLDALLRQDFSQFGPTTEPVEPAVAEISHKRRHGLIDILGGSLAGPGAPPPRIVVDTEAVEAVRSAGWASLQNQTFGLDAALDREFQHLDAAMDVVAVSEAEAALVRAHHRGRVCVLGHTITPSPTPRPFLDRSGILFVGAIHAMDHPNYDGLAWFIDEVLPLIERMLRWETRLTIAGYVAPGVTLDRFKGHSRVTLRGPVADLAPLYDANRVFIAPARFAAGIPYKVHEAAAFGLPVVTTTLLADQLGWPDGQVIGAADVTDSTGFAARVVAFHRDANLWTRLRQAALARIRSELSPDLFASRVTGLLHPPGTTEGKLSQI